MSTIMTNYRPLFGPPPSVHRTAPNRSPISTFSSFEDALRQLDLVGSGSDASPGSGESSPTSPKPRPVAATGTSPPPIETRSTASRSSSSGSGSPKLVQDPLDNFRFPASTFTSPNFAHASYAPLSAVSSQDFTNSSPRAPLLPSIARFSTPDLTKYGLGRSARSRSDMVHPTPGVCNLKDELHLAHPALLSNNVETHGPQGLRIVSTPRRDALEIAAEQGRMRGGAKGQQAWPTTALPTDDLLRTMSAEQLSKLPHEQLTRLIDLELARRGQASSKPFAGAPAPFWASASNSTFDSLPSPDISTPFGSGVRARSHTSPALAGSRFSGLNRQCTDYQIDAETTAFISSYFTDHSTASRAVSPSTNATQSAALALGSSTATAAEFGISPTPYFSGAGLLALPLHENSCALSSPSSPGLSFSIKLDSDHPSTFASSPFDNSGFAQPLPSPHSPSAYSSSSRISAQSPEVLARLQAIRLLHPGAYGTHPAPASTIGNTRQTPPHLVLAPQNRSRSTSVGNGGVNSRSPGFAHGISPAVMDPALQQYLLEHGLPLDAPSPTNKKIQLYKTEKCRSWERNVNAATPEERCVYGAKCQYAHGEHELRPVERHPKYKTQICTLFWLLGECDFGRRCCFLHDDIPPGGIPELGELRTQDALRSILMARRSLYTGASLDQLGLATSRANLASALQLSFAPTGLEPPRTDCLTPQSRSELSIYPASGQQPAPLGHRPSYDSLGSTIMRSSPIACESSLPSDRPLLRPRDRSDSLSVNMAPVPELTAVPPSLPVRMQLDYNDGSTTHGIYQRVDRVNGQALFSADIHTRALTATQAAHQQSAYQSSSSPAALREIALPRQSWSICPIQPWSDKAIGDRSFLGLHEGGHKHRW